MPQVFANHRPVAVTSVVTLIAVATSVAITEATVLLLGYGGGTAPSLLAGFIPAVMVPMTVYPLASANERLRLARIAGTADRRAG